jgi:hypothetical protein
MRLLICGSEDSRPARSPAPCAWCSHRRQPAGRLITPPCQGCCGLAYPGKAADCHCATAQTAQTMTASCDIVCRCAQTLRPASSWRQSSSWSSAVGAALPGRERRARTSRAPWLHHELQLVTWCTCCVRAADTQDALLQHASCHSTTSSIHPDATCLPAQTLGLACRSLVVSGGVACNSTVRSALQVRCLPYQPADLPPRGFAS